jgi:hypothetical protein
MSLDNIKSIPAYCIDRYKICCAQHIFASEIHRLFCDKLEKWIDQYYIPSSLDAFDINYNYFHHNINVQLDDTYTVTDTPVSELSINTQLSRKCDTYTCNTPYNSIKIHIENTNGNTSRTDVYITILISPNYSIETEIKDIQLSTGVDMSNSFELRSPEFSRSHTASREEIFATTTYYSIDESEKTKLVQYFLEACKEIDLYISEINDEYYDEQREEYNIEYAMDHS